MKLLVCLLVVLGYSLALPSPPLAWEDIKGENVYIEPVNNYTVDQPINGRIIGGSEVQRNSVPYQVAIFINGRSFCGGSLISRNYVLTAAHCTISASFVELVFGAHYVQSSESTQVRVTSTNIINHEQYQGSNLQNDISVVRTPTPITTNNHIQIISLAPATSGSLAGSIARLTGWGRISQASSGISSTLQEVELTVITNSKCAVNYGSIIVDSTVCTSGTGVVGGCNGDSGGPLVVDSVDGRVQVGIASFVSARGCESGLPTGYARVSSFRNWISQNTDA